MINIILGYLNRKNHNFYEMIGPYPMYDSKLYNYRHLYGILGHEYRRVCNSKWVGVCNLSKSYRYLSIR